MINVIDAKHENYSFDFYEFYVSETSSEKYTDFALGFGLGAKWLTKKGFLFELNSGVGRNLINSEKNDFYNHEFVGRGGFTFGYRF